MSMGPMNNGFGGMPMNGGGPMMPMPNEGFNGMNNGMENGGFQNGGFPYGGKK